jgi:4-hydroxy-tetrahydrodipicolinate synthase
MAQLCSAALTGDLVLSRRINQALMDLNEKLFVEANPIPVKWALAQTGRIPAGIRLPLTPLSSQHHDAVRAAMNAFAQL